VTETVDGAALTLEGVDNVQSGDGLALGVLTVEGGIFDDALEEHAEGATGLVIDQAGQTLDTTSARHTTDGRLGDALNVLVHDLGVTLGAGLAFASAVSFTALAHTGLAAGLAVAELCASNLTRHDVEVSFVFLVGNVKRV